jgi:very-short-patch-repair endonuclease
MPTHFHNYNPGLKKYARSLRNKSTKAEIRLWAELLRAKKMKGYTFNRQRSIDKYIVDFYASRLKLIIEVDGACHEDPAIAKNDKVRQKRLEDLGMKIVRFTNDEVFYQIDQVKERIEKTIDELEIEVRHLPSISEVDKRFEF